MFRLTANGDDVSSVAMSAPSTLKVTPAMLALSLALAVGCQPAEEGGGGTGTGGGDTPATTDESTTTDDSADASVGEGMKLVALKITSELR